MAGGLVELEVGRVVGFETGARGGTMAPTIDTSAPGREPRGPLAAGNCARPEPVPGIEAVPANADGASSGVARAAPVSAAQTAPNRRKAFPRIGEAYPTYAQTAHYGIPVFDQQ